MCVSTYLVAEGDPVLYQGGNMCWQVRGRYTITRDGSRESQIRQWKLVTRGLAEHSDYTRD